MRIINQPFTVLKEAAVVGASTLVIGMAMNKSYQVLKWDVPQPVFWALLGVWTHLAWEVVGGNQYYCKTAEFD
jgi:hypothetical protein